MMWFDLRTGDAIRIGENVVLRVVEKSGSRVRFSVEAPQAVCLKREPQRDQASQPLRLRDREVIL